MRLNRFKDGWSLLLWRLWACRLSGDSRWGFWSHPAAVVWLDLGKLTLVLWRRPGWSKRMVARCQ